LSETSCEYIHGDDHALFFSSEDKWINRIKRLTKEYPDDCKIREINKDGSLLAYIPIKWFKIAPPKRISEQQREKLKQMSIRAKKMREAKKMKK